MQPSDTLPHRKNSAHCAKQFGRRIAMNGQHNSNRPERSRHMMLMNPGKSGNWWWARIGTMPIPCHQHWKTWQPLDTITRNSTPNRICQANHLWRGLFHHTQWHTRRGAIVKALKTLQSGWAPEPSDTTINDLKQWYANKETILDPCWHLMIDLVQHAFWTGTVPTWAWSNTYDSKTKGWTSTWHWLTVSEAREMQEMFEVNYPK